MATYKPKKKIDKNGTLEEVKIPIESVDGLDSKLNTTKSLIQDLDEKVTNEYATKAEVADKIGIEEVEYLDMYMGMVEPPQTDDGIYWSENAEFRDKHGATLKTAETFHHIPISSGEGIKFEQDEEAAQVIISTDLPTVKAKLTPASEVGGGSIKTEDLPHLSYVDISTGEVDETNISTNGIFSYHKDVERELIDEDGSRHYLYSDFGLFVPIVAGDGIEFVNEENNTVSINATGDEPVYIVGSNADDGIHDVNIAADGIEFTDTYEDEYSDGSYQYPDKRTKIPIVAGEGIEFIADNENNIVKINSTVEVPTSTSQLENDSDFATKSDINALIAKTEQEFNSLITIENEGKAISYNKKMYLIVVNSTGSNPPKVGDVITELYFNTNISPDLSSVADSPISITQEDGTKHPLVYNRSGTQQLFVYRIFSSGAAVVYSTSTGWSVDHFIFEQPLTVSKTEEEDTWSNFISKTPFRVAEAVEVGGGGISGAWNSGTSGSVTLPSAGLYELKRGVEGALITHDMFYWDGISMTLNNMYDGLCVVSATGVVSFHDKDMTATFEEVFSYRKIGEA